MEGSTVPAPFAVGTESVRSPTAQRLVQFRQGKQLRRAESGFPDSLAPKANGHGSEHIRKALTPGEHSFDLAEPEAGLFHDLGQREGDCLQVLVRLTVELLNKEVREVGLSPCIVRLSPARSRK